MKKILAVFLVFTLAALMVITSLKTIEAAPVVFKYAHVEQTGDPQHRFATRMADLVKERTKGRIIVEVYPASQLGPPSEMMDGIKSGAITMGNHVHATLARYHADITVFNLPYIYTDMDQGLRASRPQTSELVREMNEHLIKKGNMRILTTMTRGWRNLSTNFPVYSVKDMKGRKIRGIPNKLWMSMLKGMGAIPVPVDIGEVHTALMTGLIEGQENPLQQQWQAKYYEVQKYLIITEHILDLLPVFINEKAYQSLSPEDRKILEACVTESADIETTLAKKAEVELKAKFKEKGMIIIEEKDGLDKKGFKEAVMAQIKKDFPEWSDYIRRIQAVK
jgi:tripartite ATP-independent transporter DctP family solute receptor